MHMIIIIVSDIVVIGIIMIIIIIAIYIISFDNKQLEILSTRLIERQIVRTHH